MVGKPTVYQYCSVKQSCGRKQIIGELSSMSANISDQPVLVREEAEVQMLAHLRLAKQLLLMDTMTVVNVLYELWLCFFQKTVSRSYLHVCWAEELGVMSVPVRP